MQLAQLFSPAFAAGSTVGTLANTIDRLSAFKLSLGGNALTVVILLDLLALAGTALWVIGQECLDKDDSEPHQALGLALLTALAGAAYFVYRYGGAWSDSDTGVLSIAISGVQKTKRLVFKGDYIHGPGYPAWVAGLGHLAHVSVPALQIAVLPFLGNAMVVMLALVVFRRLLESTALASLAAALAATNSYFLFVVSRGSHERLDISEVLICALAVAEIIGRAFDQQQLSWLIVFGISAFGLALSNDFFAAMFCLALTLSIGFFIVIAQVVTHREMKHGLVRSSGQLVTLSLIAWAMWLASFLAYTPAQTDTQLVVNVAHRLRNLLITFSLTSHPYRMAASNYPSRLLYRFAAIPRWVVLSGSMATFLIQMGRLIRGYERNHRTVLLLSLYFAYGLLMAIAIPIDFLGLSSGSNIEVRLFTYFVLFGSPLMATGLAYLLHLLQRLSARWRRRALMVLGAALVVYLPLNWMAATSDPLLTNNWSFYSPGETQSVRFFMAHHTDSDLWTGANPNGRVWAGYAMNYPETLLGSTNVLSVGNSSNQDTNAMYSGLIAAEAVRYRVSLPRFDSADRTYDNGTVQLYHLAHSDSTQR